MFRSVRNGILTIALVTGCMAPDGDKVEAARQMRSETLAELHNFDGLDDYVEIAHSNDDLLDNGTLTLWFQADSLGGETLFTKDSSGFDTGGHLNIGLVDDSIVVRLQSTKMSHTIISEDSFLTADTMHQLAFSWGADGMQLYLDGNLVGSDSYDGGLGLTSGGKGNFEPITLGASQRHSRDQVADRLTYFFAGSIKVVAIHDTVLGAASVATLYEARSGAI